MTVRWCMTQTSMNPTSTAMLIRSGVVLMMQTQSTSRWVTEMEKEASRIVKGFVRWMAKGAMNELVLNFSVSSNSQVSSIQ